MALESFYGGKQGISPVIKAKFSSKADLQTAFETSEYTDVWYSELAIIDTQNKLNKDNGKLYRRTLETVLDQGDNNYAGPHAEYLGQIVGPAGGIPNIGLTSIPYVQNTINTVEDDESVSFPTEGNLQNTDKTATLSICETTTATTSSTDNAIHLVPGYYISGTDTTPTYNDKIKYTWVNIQTPNEENNTAYMYLGFEIPYSVFEIGTVSTIDYMSTPTIEEDSTSIPHPFYWKYNFKIPRGIRGIWQEIKIGEKSPWKFNDGTPNDEKPFLYTDIANNFMYNPVTDTYKITTGAQPITTVSEDSFWYIEIKCPKSDGQVGTFYFYLEPYILPKNISFYDNSTETITAGTINLEFNDNSIKKLDSTYTQIKNAEYNKEDGSIHLTYAGVRPTISSAHIPNTSSFSDGDDRYYLMNTDATPSPLYINYIEDTYGDIVNNKFYILYSSSKYRPSDYSNDETDTREEEIEWEGKTWKRNADGNATGKYWLYLSPLKEIERNGLRVYGKFTPSSSIDSFATVSEVIEQLNNENNVDLKTSAAGQIILADVNDITYGFYYDALVTPTASWVSLGPWNANVTETIINIQDNNKIVKGISLQAETIISTSTALFNFDFPSSVNEGE